MNFFNRAIKNVTRRLSKTILLIITFFVIGNFVIIGLGVSNATENAKVLTRQKMRAVVTYGVDYNAVWRYVDSLTDQDEIDNFYTNYPQAKLSDVKALLQDERVNTANALVSNPFYQAEGFDYVHLNNEAENSDNGGMIIDDDAAVTYQSPKFFVKGNYFPNMIEFVDGGYELSDGRFYTQEEIDNSDNVCLISNALAQQNGLRVGDRFTVYIASPSDIVNDEALSSSGITVDDIALELDIIGLYEPGYHIQPDSSQFNWTQPFENPDNMILMPASTMNNATIFIQQKYFDYWAKQNPGDEYYGNPDNRPTVEKANDVSVYDVTLLLKDPLDVDSFVEEHSATLPEFFHLDANNDEFNRLAKPLDTLNLYATFIVWLVIINAIVIITLVTALTLKNREYEIGVLLSIGTSKFKIVAQFFVELAIVAIIGFTLSIISGSLIANKVGATVLEYQIQESDVNENEDDFYYNDDYINIWSSDYTSKVTIDDLVSEYSVQISPLIIAEIYILGLAIVLISILIPSMMIMRFNPKKILMNQN